jgi:hypothetical protein
VDGAYESNDGEWTTVSGPAGFGYPQRTKGRTKDRVGERAVEDEQVGNVVFFNAVIFPVCALSLYRVNGER